MIIWVYNEDATFTGQVIGFILSERDSRGKYRLLGLTPSGINVALNTGTVEEILERISQCRLKVESCLSQSFVTFDFRPDRAVEK